MSGLGLFAGGLALLLLAARFFTQTAEALGLALGMSPFAVGVTIVAVGTSLPELVSSVVAVTGGISSIAIGNVVGANTANLLMILGAIAVASPARVDLGKRYLFIDLHFLLGSAVLLGVAAWGGTISRAEGALLLAVYGIYVTYLLRDGKGASEVEPLLAEAGKQQGRGHVAGQLVVLAGCGAAIFVSARWTVDGLERIAQSLAIPPAIAAATLLSLGTTLPELAVSVVAARRGQPSLAAGNILGSCVFNSLAVAGTAALVGKVTVPGELLGFALPFYAVAALLFYLLIQDSKISRWEGLLFLALFVLFLGEVGGLL